MPAAMGNRDSERLSDIKCILRSLLISNSKQDVTLPRLNSMFKEEEGENIPYREFDYPSLQEFLRSMPDVMHLRYNREHQLCAYHVDTEESAHISSLISRQKNSQKRTAKFNVSYNKPRGNSHGNYYSNYSRPPAKSSTMSTLNSLRLVLDELRNAPKYFQKHNGIRKCDILQKFKDRPGRSSIKCLQTLNAKLKQLSDLVLDEDYVYFKEDVFTSNVHAGSNSMQKSTAKYACQNLEVRSAPSQPTLPAPQLNQIKGPHPSQTSQMSFTVQPAANRIPKAILTPDEPAQKSTRINCQNEVINERIKIRLQKLMERYPEGIWAADLPSLYFKEYRIDLNYHELGFNSITEFASAVPEILTITDPEDTGMHMILDARIPLNKTQCKQQSKSLASHYNFNDFIADDKEPVPNKLSPTVCQKFIPEGMMGFDETVDHISVGSLACEDYFEVNISEIFTPSFFWITLRKNKSKIKKLMDELDEFYKLQDLDACRLPQVLIGTGLNVACVYAKMWHRAIIKKVKPDGYAVVLFYDYGTVKTYNPNDLYYLHKRFSALPAQALACGLYNVKTPHGHEWPIFSTNKFVKKVWDVPLIATVCETNENNNTMMITLTDTSDSFDLHLNDWMIASGFAVHGKMENTPSNKYHVVTYGVPLDKLCMYDEDALRKRDLEYEKCLEMKEHGETSSHVETEQAHIKDADVFPNYNADSSCDTSSIYTLVQENISLTKQTNTITQAILSNMPVNTQIDRRRLGAPCAPVTMNTSEYESYSASDSCFEDIKKTSSNLNRNLNAIENNFTEMINDSRADLFKSAFGHQNQIDRNFNPESSAVSLNSLPSSFDYAQSTQHSSNEFVNNRASNQSFYSHQSTVDFQNQANLQFDKLSVSDGTPTYYSVKKDANLPNKSQIPNKYPSTFVNTMIDQSKINNNLNAHRMKGSDEGYQTIQLASSTQTSRISSTTSLQSKSVPFAPIELSERCFRKIIHIFHVDNEGWVPVNEFIDCFTNLKLARIMFKLLDTFKISVDYKHLTRTEDPQFFSQLDESQMKAPRDYEGKIKSDFVLILMPMRAMLHVLDKLEFVDGKTFKEASSLIKQEKQNAADVLFERFNNKILYDVLNLLIQYRQFKRLHTPHSTL